jgi:hypothetical protein
MTPLHQPTQRRLQKIPQVSSIWEGDRRPCFWASALPSRKTDEDYIIWADGSEGVVRAIEVVPPVMGLEAIVRTLLRAMEAPMSPLSPARPQKIVVRDREIQFFLRGVLQDLDIAVEYAVSLPLIEELFNDFEEDNQPPLSLSPPYDQLLKQITTQIWDLAPWEILGDHNILTIELNQWGTECLYVCVLGQLDQEYGILLYRNLESLLHFRKVVQDSSPETLEKAFLEQDCWFLTYELEEDELTASEFNPDISWGSIHPYEGVRVCLDEEEALTLYVALKSFYYFVEDVADELELNLGSVIQKSYGMTLPSFVSLPPHLQVNVSTAPDLDASLLKLTAQTAGENLTSFPGHTIQDDLIPENALISFGVLPREWQQEFSQYPRKYHHAQGDITTNEEFPVILIQTSRPKAQKLIKNLQQAQGVMSICFTLGEDPLTQEIYNLGILQMGNQELQLFGEFPTDDPHQQQIRQRWEDRTQKAHGCCGLVIASGVTGLARGKPTLKEMIALFEAKVVAPDTLGLGLLQLTPVIR